MRDRVAHAPYLHGGQDCHTMIIFIHGILGSPVQFKPLVSAAVNAGYAASAMLLPGHGGTGRDFARSSRSQWETAVRAHIARMNTRYANIVLVGHSMGSLLAFSSYSHYPDSIKGIVAIATPLRIRIASRAIQMSLKVALGRDIEADMQAKAALDSSSVERSSIWTYLSGVPRYIDLLHLIHDTRRVLNRIDAPVLTIHSIDDEVASVQGTVILEEELDQCETLLLPRSGHYFYSEQDTASMVDAFLRFLESLQFDGSFIR